MSWEIFKNNILAKANNPESIKDIDTVAKLYATEYDACMKRGGDTINRVALKKGNTEIMEQLFKAALQKGLSSTTPYDLVGEMGKGVLAYWQGAILNEFPFPLIPSPGAISNIGVTSNIVTTPGTWTPAITIPATPSASPPISTQSLLDEIPDDNNTIEGVKAVAELTGKEIVADAGDVPGPQLSKLLDDLPADTPTSEIIENAEPDTNPPPDNKKEAEVIKCGVGVDYDAKISPNYALKDVSIGAVFRHKIKEQRGLSESDIVCNLQNLAINILEPLRAQFPSTRINSGFRGTPSIPGGVSQHEKGEAVDIQFPGFSNSKYLEAAKWVRDNLPFDQLIFEHGNSIWLHISCKRNGTQRKQLLTMWEGYLKYTDRDPPSKYRGGLVLHYKD
jgi:hypothetical protein